MSQPVLFTRQPVFDGTLNTFAYQLAFAAEQTTEHQAGMAAELLVNAFSNLLEQGCLRYLPALIHYDVEWLYAGKLPEVAEKTLLLDLTTTQEFSDQLYDHLAELVAKGYRVVVSPQAEARFLALAAIVRVDIRDCTEVEFNALMARLKGPNKPQLLADQVNSHEQYNFAKSLGFELFLGSFFAQPQYIKGRKLARNETVMFQLIGEVNHPDATAESIEKVLQRDPELVASILRLVNSAAFRGRRVIASISEAIVLLGIVELRKWVLMFALCHNKQVPSELISVLLVKAKMAELLARDNPQIEAGTAFMTGILSGMDAILGMPMDELMQQLPVPVEVKRALSGGKNPLGLLLASVDSYSRGEWTKLAEEHQRAVLANSYQSALLWSNELLEELN